MRVHVYKLPKGAMTAMIEPSPGKGRAPVVVQGVTTGNVRERVLPEVVAMRAPKAPRPGRLSHA